LPWKGGTTTFGLFQTAYQGSPQFSFIDIGANFGSQSPKLWLYTAGQVVNMSRIRRLGDYAWQPLYQARAWFTQSDINLAHSIKTGEHQAIGFTVNVFNA